VPADLGLQYQETSGECISTVARLWQADLDQVHVLLTAPLNVAAWNAAALPWVVCSGARVQLVEPADQFGHLVNRRRPYRPPLEHGSGRRQPHRATSSRHYPDQAQANTDMAHGLTAPIAEPDASTSGGT
jgi:hypothetical protein